MCKPKWSAPRKRETPGEVRSSRGSYTHRTPVFWKREKCRPHSVLLLVRWVPSRVTPKQTTSPRYPDPGRRQRTSLSGRGRRPSYPTTLVPDDYRGPAYGTAPEGTPRRTESQEDEGFHKVSVTDRRTPVSCTSVLGTGFDPVGTLWEGRRLDARPKQPEINVGVGTRSRVTQVRTEGEGHAPPEDPR